VTELMKQKQYAPMSVAEMGVVLFAANEGFLRDVEINKIALFEAALLSYMKAEHGDFMAEITKTGAYNDDIVATMRAAIEKFKATQTF
jgi:F-type H+/Na+-transporting ATPase subunit alpha